VHAQRQATRDRIAGRERPAAERFRRCEACNGPGEACEACGGAGLVELPKPEAEPLPELLEPLGAFLESWAMIDRYGVEGWRSLTQPAVERAEPVDEAFVQGLLVFTGELERLEAEREARDLDAKGPNG
jgi:hypothetical protein